MTNEKSFSYEKKSVEGVIFDLDGTLYNQLKMQAYMARDLFFYYTLHPHKLYELRILYYFRKKRYESDGSKNIEQKQYEVISRYLQVPLEEVRRIVSIWIEEKPLKYMKDCGYKYACNLFKRLQIMGINVGVVSDYPVAEKLRALGLYSDVAVCSTDKEVDSFKPNPEGFLLAAKNLGVKPENCLVIGDRDDKDGEGARRAGMIFIKSSKNISRLFDDVKE